ncbi:MAG: hypothetical protein U0805_15850 [Pirellulales bacterium]
MASGNGNGFGIDPKWNSYIDTTVRETLESLGQKVSSLGLSESEQWHAELATATALIYAGYTIVWGYTDESATKTKEFAEVTIARFFAGLTDGSGQS